MVTENTSFPGKGSLKAFNGYRRKEFSAQRDTKGTMVTEERSLPAKGTLKAFNGYRRKEFSTKWVTKVPQ
jgi:hypothetical protein